MDELNQNNSSIKFKCPKCGDISQDDVVFLCNTCDQVELIEKEGAFLCPKCLKPGENFECMLCGSKEVSLITKIPGNSV